LDEGFFIYIWLRALSLVENHLPVRGLRNYKMSNVVYTSLKLDIWGSRSTRFLRYLSDRDVGAESG